MTSPTTQLFAAQHADRYARQQMIGDYEKLTGARLIVVIDQIFSHGTTLLEELLQECDPNQPLHLMLATPGGDGEVAVRLVRAMQARCSELSIIVPDMAKSAGTIMCLGANHIIMGPASDLGPVDPQFRLKGELVGAKEIEQAVKAAEERVAASPDTFALYSGLLAELDMVMIEQARSAIARSHALVGEALACRGLDKKEKEALAKRLQGPLIDESKYHGATVGPGLATEIGLPVILMDPASEQWQLIWSLWTRYFHIGAGPAGGRSVYEGRKASQIFGGSTT